MGTPASWVVALTALGVFVPACGNGTTSDTECDCSGPGALSVVSSDPITLTASGVCAIESCASGLGGANAVSGGSICTVSSSTAGSCTLTATFPDGKTTRTTVTFATATGCCPGLYSSELEWRPSE